MKTHYNTPSMNDCAIIANGIAEENSKKPHMMPIKAHELYNTIHSYGGIGMYTEKNDLIGIVKITPIGSEVYEWGSLFILDEHRGKGFSHHLIKYILSTYANLALLCVTNVPQVIQVCKDLNQVELYKETIKKEVLRNIENGQALLVDDHVFGNQNFITMAQL